MNSASGSWRLTPGTRHLSLLLLLLLGVSVGGRAQTSADSDQDGITDAQEQLLLEKFRPTFMISSKDCAVRPARFEPGVADPKPVAADGTIYGQVFPAPNSKRIEIHYYTLWERDCGRNGHPFDVEHVATLVSNEPDATPKALYWYAGAHEKTACNISSGARAEAIGAEDRGPTVWSASGKHALYLRQSMCGHGCGADFCGDAVELARNGEVINVGEREAPANGATWVKSPNWVLAEKMDSDFPAAMLARLDATSGETVITLSGSSTFRGTIAVSDTVLGSATNGAEHTGAALETANTHTSNSLGTATRATGRSLKRAWRAVFGPRKTPPAEQKP